MKTPLIEKLTEFRSDCGLSFDKLGEKAGISGTTINRWYNGKGCPSLEEIEILCDAMGHDIREIFVEVGKQEMVATQSIGYQGAEAMVEHYEARLAAKDEKYNLLQAHHEQRIEEINGNHGRAVEYLKEDIKRLRKERDEYRSECEALKVSSAEEISRAHKAASDVTGKKHVVYWVSTGLNVLLAIAVIIALLTDSII